MSMDYPSRPVPSIFQELKHLKREPFSSILTCYPDMEPAAGDPQYTYHGAMVLDSSEQHQVWRNGPKLESDPVRSSSHNDFYLSEDEVTFLNELFKSDPADEPVEYAESNVENAGADEEQKMEMKEQPRKIKGGPRKRAARSSRFTKSSALDLEEIQKYFDMPITLAAKKMNVGLTVLKKRCRELNIMRWPHRKIKSLKSLISNVKELGLEKEIQMLEEHRMMLEKMPQVELTEKTKKLRQACFKANYKKRRQVLASSRCFSAVK